MAVMKSGLIGGQIIHTLTANMDDNPRFSSDGYQMRLSFQNLTSQTMTGYVHNDELADKSKYWKTEELVRQLKGMKAHYERMRDHWKAKDNGLGLALKYSQRLTAVDEILRSLANGENIWED